MQKGKELYYAVNRDGRGNVFTSLPIRNEQWGIWEGTMESCLSGVVDSFMSDGMKLPIITYNEEPLKLTLSIGF